MVFNDKSNVIQVLESNYIDSNCLYSQKRLVLQKFLLLLSVTPCEKVVVTQIQYVNFFVRPLKAEVLKSHIIFIIQNSYGGRAFLPPSRNRVSQIELLV